MRLTFILAASLMLGTVHADSYKWTDADGVVHYTQTPPPARAYQEIGSPTAKVEAGAPSSYERAQQAQRRFEAQEQEEKAQAETRKEQALVAELRQKNCVTARQAVESLTVYRQMLIEKDGEKVRMTEPQRQNQLNTARANVDEYCGG